MKNKITIEYIKRYISDHGYKYLSGRYESARTRNLRILCDKGHTYITSWNQFKNGTRCSVCANEFIKGDYRRHNLEYIKSYVSRYKECEYISGIYKNTYSKLKFKCNICGRYFEKCFKVIQRSSTKYGCPYCNRIRANRKMALTIDYIKNMVNEFNDSYVCLSNEYKNSSTKLTFRCPKNHIFDMRWYDFSTGRRCPKCNTGRVTKFSIKYIKEKVPQLAHGYTCISDKYINNSTKLKFKCSKGHIFEMPWRDFYNSNHRCPICYEESRKSDYDLTQYNLYKRRIEILTRRNYKEYKHIINPYNLPRGNNKYHIDHIV